MEIAFILILAVWVTAMLMSVFGLNSRDREIEMLHQEIAKFNKEKKEQDERIATLTQAWQDAVLEQLNDSTKQQEAIDLFRASLGK